MVLGLMPPLPCTGMDIPGAAGLVRDCSFSDIQLPASSSTSNTKGAIGHLAQTGVIIPCVKQLLLRSCSSWGNGSEVMSACRGSVFGSQTPRGDFQLPASPISEDPAPSFGLCIRSTHGTHIYRQTPISIFFIVSWSRYPFYLNAITQYLGS